MTIQWLFFSSWKHQCGRFLQALLSDRPGTQTSDFRGKELKFYSLMKEIIIYENLLFIFKTLLIVCYEAPDVDWWYVFFWRNFYSVLIQFYINLKIICSLYYTVKLIVMEGTGVPYFRFCVKGIKLKCSCVYVVFQSILQSKAPSILLASTCIPLIILNFKNSYQFQL